MTSHVKINILKLIHTERKNILIIRIFSSEIIDYF